MKKTLAIIAGFLALPLLAMGAQSVFTSNQIATSTPSSGYVPVSQGSGLPAVWTATSSLGISGGGGAPAGTSTNIQYNLNGAFGGIPGSYASSTDADGFPYDELFTRTYYPITTAPSDFSGWSESGCDSCWSDGTVLAARIFSYTIISGQEYYSSSYLDAGSYTVSSGGGVQISWAADPNPAAAGYIVVFSENGSDYTYLSDVGSNTNYSADNYGFPSGPGAISNPPAPFSISADTYVNHASSTDFFGIDTDQDIHAKSITLDACFPASAGGTGNCSNSYDTNGLLYWDGTKFATNPNAINFGGTILASNFLLQGQSGVGLQPGPNSSTGELVTGGINAIDYNGSGVCIHCSNPSSIGGALVFGTGYASGANIQEEPVTGAGGTGLGLFGGAGQSASNVSGGNVTIAGGTGTGTGTPSSIIFKAPSAAAPGTTAQTLSEVARFYNGHFGIGTTTPAFPFTLAGDSYLSGGTYYHSTTSPQTSDNELFSDGSGYLTDRSNASTTGNNRTIFQVSSPRTGGANEGTLTTLINYTGGNQEGVDWFNQNYGANADQAGIDEWNTGTGTLKVFCMSYWPGLAGSYRFNSYNAYCTEPNGTTAFGVSTSTAATNNSTVFVGSSTAPVLIAAGGTPATPNFIVANNGSTSAPYFTASSTGTTTAIFSIGGNSNVSDYGFGIAGGRSMFGYDVGRGSTVVGAGSSKGIDFYVNGSNNSYLSGLLAAHIDTSGHLGLGSATSSCAYTLCAGQYFSADGSGLMNLGYSPIQMYQDAFGSLTTETQNPGYYFPRMLGEFDAPADNVAGDLGDQEAGQSYKLPVNGGGFSGGEWTNTQGIEIGAQKYTCASPGGLCYSNVNYINSFMQGNGTTTPIAISFENKNLNSFEGRTIGAWFDPSGAVAVGNYASTTGGYPNRYSTSTALQVLASSTAQTVAFDVETSARSCNIMCILTGGNIGMGTSTPVGNLDIVGKSGQNSVLNIVDAGTSNTSSLTLSASAAAGTGLRIQHYGSAIGSGLNNTGEIWNFDASGNAGIRLGGNSGEVERVDTINGRVGIGTSTPSSKLEVEASAGSATAAVLVVATSTNASVETVGADGHVITGGGTPSLTSCGTSPSITGNDRSGQITFGTGALLTSCTVTFSVPYTNEVSADNKVHVFVNQDSGSLGIFAAQSVTRTGFNITTALSGATGDAVSYEVVASN